MDAALLGVVVVEFEDAAHERHDVGLAAVQFHLVLVNLALVENLVHQQHQSLGITVDGLDVFQALFVVDALLQFLQRPHDERQRRADVVGGVDEELHL